MLYTRDSFILKDTHMLKVKEWKKIIYTNYNHQRAGVVVLISGKMVFKSEMVARNKEGHYIMNKRINPPRRYSNYKYRFT